MCEISKKTKVEMKVLASIVCFIPFGYMTATIRLSEQSCGWWVCALMGLAACIYIPWFHKG